jgi:hypothetical protein
MQLTPMNVERRTQNAELRSCFRLVFFILNSAFCVLNSFATTLTINADQPVFVDTIPYEIHGTTDAAPGTPVAVTVGDWRGTTVVASNGEWRVVLTEPHTTGTYTLNVSIGDAQTSELLRVQLNDRLQRQSPFGEPAPKFGTPEQLSTVAGEVMTDRWRIVPPPYELDEHSRGRLDPYNKNIYKGDYPIRGKDTFLVLTGISDTLAESRTLPTPSGVSAVHQASLPFFGNDDQNVFAQNFIVTADAYQGDTTFQPIRQRIRATLIANITHLAVNENGIVKPDVRRGTSRTTEHVSLQELFYERKLRDLSPNYDFASIRIGEQPFSSDFRGFVFSDTNVGARLFGNYASNRWQYNLAIFDRLEKDTNSGLNTLADFRGQQVAVANVYKQDFLVPGYTQQVSIHFVHDDGGLHYDRNGILVRPAPVGDFRQHTVRATYLGEAGLGHAGRFNIDQAVYVVFGRDSHNPIAARSTEIRAGMAAAEVSIDRDWIRPRLGFFYASGDKNPRDGDARGFDSIFDAPNFAGGGFSFLNRMGIRLAGTGVVLIDRGSLLPSLRSSKEEGQPNYVNPGLRLITAGVDLDITPRLKTIFTINHAQFDAVEPLEAILFQGGIHRDLGTDISLGARFRPFLSNNWIISGGLAAFRPGQGFKDIYEDPGTLYHLFTNVTLQF